MNLWGILARAFVGCALMGGASAVATGAADAVVGVGDATAVGPRVPAPDLRCSTSAQAIDALQQVGLTGQVIAGSTGVVLSQSPPAGQPMAVDAPVFFTLQTPGQDLFVVPDVRRPAVPVARRVLAASCLTVELAKGDVDGDVLRQSPSPGARVKAGTTVTVVSTTAKEPAGQGTISPGSSTPGGPGSPVGTTSSGSSRGTAVGLLAGPAPVALLVVALVMAGWLGLVRPRRQARALGSAVPAIVRKDGGDLALGGDDEDGRDLGADQLDQPSVHWMLRREPVRTAIEEAPQ